jgi:hypothetical protein
VSKTDQATEPNFWSSAASRNPCNTALARRFSEWRSCNWKRQWWKIKSCKRSTNLLDCFRTTLRNDEPIRVPGHGRRIIRDCLVGSPFRFATDYTGCSELCRQARRQTPGVHFLVTKRPTTSWLPRRRTYSLTIGRARWSHLLRGFDYDIHHISRAWIMCSLIFLADLQHASRLGLLFSGTGGCLLRASRGRDYFLC